MNVTRRIEPTLTVSPGNDATLETMVVGKAVCASMTMAFPAFTGIRCLMMPYIQGQPSCIISPQRNMDGV